MQRYDMNTSKTYQETMGDLAETFQRWGVTQWQVWPLREGSTSRSWSLTDEERRVKVTYQHPRSEQMIELEMADHSRPRDNLRVLYLGIEAMRMNERRGLSNVMASQYLQLEGPKGPVKRDPYEVLGVRPDAPWEDIRDMYRVKARRVHPDRGGDKEAFQELTAAYEEIAARHGETAAS